MLAAGNLLGILEQDPEAWLQGGVDGGVIDAEAIETLIVDLRDPDYRSRRVVPLLPAGDTSGMAIPA
mgnify:CR=1 FL=1